MAVDVCAGGSCTYSTIFDANSASAEGDVISIAAGTYNETQAVVVNKTLTFAYAAPPHPSHRLLLLCCSC